MPVKLLRNPILAPVWIYLSVRASEGNHPVIRIIYEMTKNLKNNHRDNRLHKCSNFPSKYQGQNLNCSENATF
jgi:hypothetical protein